MKVKETLQEKYSEQYLGDTDKWRRLGGKGKAKNIIKVASKGQNKFSVLDVGSGDGSVLYWLDKFGFSNDITSVEISQSGIDRIKDRKLQAVKQILLFDGYSLPFDDDHFDLVLCSHVIEHVEYPRRLLREIARVSKEQIFEIPIDFSINVDKKAQHFFNYGHINIYTPQTFRFLLKSEGLDIISYYNALYEEEVFDYMYKDKSLFFKLINKLKRLLWKRIPFLMGFKPNTTTVKTQKSSSPLSIM